MYVVTDLKNRKAYVSSCLKPVADKIGVTTETLRNWKKKPGNALKKGFFVCQGERLKSNRNFPEIGHTAKEVQKSDSK
ncbi:MAG: hypothetical protein JRJ62_17005 [Deltaproteobacteria bacterium]|nr:hypothetical protein [Deltaproteobacteria bacterium]